MREPHHASTSATSVTSVDATPPLDACLPDEIIIRIGVHAKDVCVPSHIGCLASTNKMVRQLLAETLAAQRSEHEEAKVRLRRCDTTLEEFMRERPTAIDWFRKGLKAADAPVLERFLLSEASARVTALVLDFNPEVGSAGVSAITAAAAGGGLKQLKKLDLAGINMGDEGVQTLGACLGDGGLPNLERIFLARSGISDDGLKSLAESLAATRAPALKCLTLGSNTISDKGVKVLMATAAKGKLAKLEMLSLDANPFGSAGAEALTAAVASGDLPGLTYLSVPQQVKDQRHAYSKLKAASEAQSVDLVYY